MVLAAFPPLPHLLALWPALCRLHMGFAHTGNRKQNHWILPQQLRVVGVQFILPSAWCWMLLKCKTKNILYLMFRYKKKKRFCSCRLIQIKCKAQRLALWVASYSVCILNSSISMFYIYGREGTRTCLECVFACHGYNREKSWTVGKDRYVWQWRKAQLCLKAEKEKKPRKLRVTHPCGTITLNVFLGSMTWGSVGLKCASAADAIL